ncbi:MAG: PorT family protein [Bacteroidota bacterium]|nr:PorT family protein [Bacteroidota bacterium]MDX5404697.1 PorT family protein [Bacteroidota bacterium]MDX5427645.1 PorT family protein [Bacteroidota bacterium]MDX5448380.1 PorT family protein [Bacteroidota bacterium]MDX5505553.1 PorT family protein [Bacteroidota bacterium]
MKRTLLYIILLSFAAGPIFGQRKLKNQPKYDSKIIHFGFFLGINYYDLLVKPKGNLSTMPGYYGFRTETNPGYTINIVSDLKLMDHLHLRFLPGFSSTVRTLYFDIDDPFTGERGEAMREVESSFIELPFELQFQSKRINNYRWYVLGELKNSIDLASKEKVEDDRLFKLKSHDLTYGFGVGLDFYFEYFKFSPQIKASFGLSNLLVEDGTAVVSGLEGVYTRAIFINFTFE